MPRKIWANASEKTQACDIRREAKEKGLPIPTNDEIILRLRAKQINSNSEKPSDAAINKHPSAFPPGGTPPPGVSLPADLLLIVQYTAIAQQTCPTWRPADTIAYLEKSKQIAPPEDTSKKELNNYHEVRHDFFNEEYSAESVE